MWALAPGGILDEAVKLPSGSAAFRALGHTLVVFRYTEHDVFCGLIWQGFGNRSRLHSTAAPVFRMFEKAADHGALSMPTGRSAN
jgi:hypothetical protein